LADAAAIYSAKTLSSARDNCAMENGLFMQAMFCTFSHFKSLCVGAYPVRITEKRYRINARFTRNLQDASASTWAHHLGSPGVGI
jgi:hypothetical protein